MKHTIDKNLDVNDVHIEAELFVKDRNILNELDNLHKSMLLLPRDQEVRRQIS